MTTRQNQSPSRKDGAGNSHQPRFLSRLLRLPALWGVFVILSAAAWWFTVAHFHRAFPAVDMEVTLDRAGALAAAEELAERHGWGTEDFQQAVTFEHDEPAQVFVELEGGGPDVFLHMLHSRIYEPYRWQVRHFAPGQTIESAIFLTPDGQPYGFRLTLPEDAPGATLDAEAARRMAEEVAADAWRVDFEDFELVEAAKLERSQRLDHTLVYERPEHEMGAARLRLQLQVSGDQLTQLEHVFEAPEVFDLRFAQMRARNRALSSLARVVMLVVLLGGGCLGGLLFLLRRRAVAWRPAIAVGLGIGLLQGAAELNRMGQWWVEYDSALSRVTFLAERLAALVIEITWLSLGTILVVAVAEGLTRMALPGEVRLWRSWRPAAAASPSILGRTAGVYLLLGIYCAYKVAFFMAASRIGWWVPASQGIDPNSLATPLPWLGPIAAALRAGVGEESLFRAIPLAAAILLGRRFGQTRTWIGAALVFQALVFGAAHAFYPNMPAYARLVELFFPALAYGVLYLRFGLLPAILMHTAFDVLAFGLTLLTSSSPAAALHRWPLVLFVFLPLGIVLVSRWRRGHLEEAPPELRNAAWTPPPENAVRVAPEHGGELRPAAFTALGAVAVLGVVLAGISLTFPPAVRSIDVDRADAEGAARAEAERRGWDVADLTALAGIRVDINERHRFAWQQAGAEGFGKLIGNYLEPPRWLFRFLSLQDDPARSEEYQISIGPDGKPFGFFHRWPPDAGGASLERAAARTLALAAIENRFGATGERLEDIALIPNQRSARRDWIMTFRDAQTAVGEGGEARIMVMIAGDEVVACYRLIHPGENWRRVDRDRAARLAVLHDLSFLGIALLLLGGALAAVTRWSQGHFATRPALRALAVLVFAGLIMLANHWPSMRAGLSAGSGSIKDLLPALRAVVPTAAAIIMALALQVGLTLRLPSMRVRSSLRVTLLAGLALGCAGGGLMTLLLHMPRASTPPWLDYGAVLSMVPWLGVALTALATYGASLLVALSVFLGIDHLTDGWRRRKFSASLLLVMMGFGLRAWAAPSLKAWFIEGAVIGAGLLVAYAFVLCRQMSLLPATLAAGVLVVTLRNGIDQPFGSALFGAVLAVILVLAAAIWWTAKLANSPAAGAAADEVSA